MNFDGYFEVSIKAGSNFDITFDYLIKYIFEHNIRPLDVPEFSLNSPATQSSPQDKCCK
jgi:hypothetical protein